MVCGEPVYEEDGLDTLRNPLLLIEILSPTTERYDRGDKFRRYRGFESLREYVLVSQEAPAIDVYALMSPGWVLRDYAGLEATLALSSLGIEIPLAEIYARVEF